VRVFDLTGREGNYETSPNGYPPGTRSFGFWSYGTPVIGDLVSFLSNRTNSKVLYQIKSVALNFTGSNSDNFWKGVMIDVIYNKMLTEEMVGVLQREGLAPNPA